MMTYIYIYTYDNIYIYVCVCVCVCECVLARGWMRSLLVDNFLIQIPI